MEMAIGGPASDLWHAQLLARKAVRLLRQLRCFDVLKG
jgi:hypothetical protein